MFSTCNILNPVDSLLHVVNIKFYVCSTEKEHEADSVS